MKFTIRIMQAGTTILEGELMPGTIKNRYDCTEQACSDDDIRQAAFAVEKAINQQTPFRCHVSEQQE